MVNDTAVIITAWRRPWYLRRALGSWSRAEGFGDLGRVIVSLGKSSPDMEREQADVVQVAAAGAGREIEIWPDSPAAAGVLGEHRALGEAISEAFEDGATFVISTSEDVCVSDDVLAYFAWCRQAARQLPAAPALLINAHNELGQGWHTWHDDTDAAQDVVRCVRGAFNPWCWGTWDATWRQILEPGWDWDATSGQAVTEHGWDWQAHRLAQDWPTFTPAASRALNIGQYDGVYAHPAAYPQTRARSFRARRGHVTYRLANG